QPRPDHPGGSGPADDGPDRPRPPRAARRDLMDRIMSDITEDLWSVGRLLKWTTDFLHRKGSESPRLDAEVLLAHVLGCERVQLYTHFEDEVREDARAAFRDLVRRRAEGMPVA